MTFVKKSWGIIAVTALVILTLIIIPLTVPFHIILQITLYFSYAILALSLAFVWGFAGIFSFGQAAFFGLGGYTYAILAINIGESTLPLIGGLLLPAGFALVLGYFMFYGRLSTVYVAVITLVVTLIIYKFLGHTAGFEYSIGKARLGGYNGIPGIPPLNLPGDPSKAVWPEDMFYVSGIALLLTYLGLHFLSRSKFGRIVAGLRENELRVDLLGYDVRFYKMIALTIGAMIAAIGGITFANWNGFIDPNVFNLGMSAQTIIWVVVGGLGTFIGPILAAIALGFLTIELGTQQTFDVNMILGAILILFVLIVPQGIVPSILRAWQKYRDILVTRRANPAKGASNLE